MAFFTDDVTGAPIDSGTLAAVLAARDATLTAKTEAVAAASTASAAQSSISASAAAVTTTALTAAASAATAATAQSDAEVAQAAAEAAQALAEAAQLEASSEASDSAQARDEAQDLLDEAYLVAKAPRGTEVAEGIESAWSYLEQTKEAATVASLMSVVPVTATGTREILASDLNKTVKFSHAAGATYSLVPGIFSTPAPDGGEALAWLKVLRASGAGDLVISAGGAGTTLQPSRLTDQLFTYRTTSAVVAATSESHDFVVPAGVKRAIVVMAFAIHDTANGSRASSCGSTNTTAFTKVENDNSLTAYNASQGVNSVMWRGTLADAVVPTTVTLTPVFDDCWSYELWAVAYSDVDDYTNQTGSSPSTDTNAPSVSLTAPELKCVNLFGLAIQGNDALPWTLGADGVQRYAGSTGARNEKDLSFIFGVHESPPASAVVYSATAAVTDDTANLGITLRPDTVGTATVDLVTEGVTTLTGSVRHATIFLSSDGFTYYLET
jgi:hypothetical protein